MNSKRPKICRSRHSSLIPLNRVAVFWNCLYSVYEYIHGANRPDALRSRRKPNFTILSNWMLRVQIVPNIASGLDFIHNSPGLGFDFVHNQIQHHRHGSSTLRAKICHFGTTELCGEIAKRNSESGMDVESNCKEMKFEGTRGYMAPEFQSTGAMS
ncbi:unnamed protein product [Cuscuta campestris]|uniref:Protein kinase domain-containing protein n=1 Tax=Cuscuta campestris TaxID=132261 RepID=A0A484L0K7_9ASTE|nr:unnamed protein product [Cuscuta campestris]